MMLPSVVAFEILGEEIFSVKILEFSFGDQPIPPVRSFHFADGENRIDPTWMELTPGIRTLRGDEISRFTLKLKYWAHEKQKKDRAQKLGTEKTSTEKLLHSMDFDFEIRQSYRMFANTLSGSWKGGGGGIKSPIGPGFIDHCITHAHKCVCCV